MSPAAKKAETTKKAVTRKPRVTFKTEADPKTPQKHFQWNRKAFATVIATLDGEAKRLRTFNNSCPQGRAADVESVRNQLRNLLNWNPPNYNNK